jgi:hypothetical protein
MLRRNVILKVRSCLFQVTESKHCEYQIRKILHCQTKLNIGVNQKYNLTLQKQTPLP